MRVARDRNLLRNSAQQTTLSSSTGANGTSTKVAIEPRKKSVASRAGRASNIWHLVTRTWTSSGPIAPEHGQQVRQSSEISRQWLNPCPRTYLFTYLPTTFDVSPYYFRRISLLLSLAALEEQTGIAIHRADSRARLPGIAVPTLVVAGADDRVCPLGRGVEIAAAVPGSRFVQLPGVGHFVPLEAPDALAGALGAWLGGTDP